MAVRALSWNLFHGRDHPPEPELLTWRSRLLRLTERGRAHAQVNTDLRSAFESVLAGAEWDVALLQECPPRWQPGFERECGAESFRSLTSRNWLEKISWAIARRWPDLIGSSEGGSNLILARGAAGGIVETREWVMEPATPERRTMAFARLECGLCVTSLHASTSPPQAERELLVAAERAVEWAAGSPLILGGDFNVRPARSDLYEELKRRFGLRGPTRPNSIDHLLVRDAEVIEAARAWPPEARELAEDGLALRLSDHAPVEITVGIGG